MFIRLAGVFLFKETGVVRHCTGGKDDMYGAVGIVCIGISSLVVVAGIFVSGIFVSFCLPQSLTKSVLNLVSPCLLLSGFFPQILYRM